MVPTYFPSVDGSSAFSTPPVEHRQKKKGDRNVSPCKIVFFLFIINLPVLLFQGEIITLRQLNVQAPFNPAALRRRRPQRFYGSPGSTDRHALRRSTRDYGPWGSLEDTRREVSPRDYGIASPFICFEN